MGDSLSNGIKDVFRNCRDLFQARGTGSPTRSGHLSASDGRFRDSSVGPEKSTVDVDA